jgi:GNAT superfamily N-acetyltransferase
MEVYEIDPADDAAIEVWRAVHTTSRIAAWPDDPPFTFDEVRGMAIGGFGNRVVLALARDGADNVVGCSMLSLPINDNTWTAILEVEVDPAHRRCGAGRALVAHSERVARAEARTTVNGPYEERLDAPAPGRAFAESMGYETAMTEFRRDLRLPVDVDTLDRLEAACLPFAAGYDIVAWLDRCPDELVEGLLELQVVISRDAPHGDLDHELAVWDEPRLRAGEHALEEMGQTAFHAGAVAEAGNRLVAVTTLAVPREAPAVGRQFGTMVRAEDRGHRLGILVKIANVRALMEHSPETTNVRTWNAETNAYMSRLNDQLGFAITARAVFCQKRLGEPTPAKSA